MIVFCYDDFYEEYKDCLTNDIGIKEAQKLGLKGCNIYDVNKLRDCKDGIDLIVCDYRRIQELARIVVVNEELDPLGYGYQQRLGKIALGSGKLFGKGLFADDYSFVPEVQTDFILTYVGQCFGFIGCIALIAALSFICLKIMADSRISKDNLGKYMCVGVSAMLFIHCVLNIGMVLVVTPVIGVPLPFVSQGGTAMLSMFLGIGLVMSVYSHSEKKYRVFYDAN